METKLICGLPAIRPEGTGYWVVFSPYRRQIARVPDAQIDAPGVQGVLDRAGLLGQPCRTTVAGTNTYQITFITNNRCQCDCQYCFKQGERPIYLSPEIAIDRLVQATNEYRERCARKLYVDFFGGEPTLNHRCVSAVVEYLKEHARQLNVTAFEFGITTNGIVRAEVLAYLLENQFRFTVSADGIPQVQDKQRPLKNGRCSSPAVENTLATIQKCPGASVERVRATVTAASAGQMAESVAYYSRFGVKVIHFEPAILPPVALRETNGTFTQVSAASFVANFLKALQVAIHSGVRLLNGAFMNIMSPSRQWCEAVGNGKTIVSPSGHLTTCLEVHDSKHPLGQHFLKQSLRTETRLGIREVASESQRCAACFARYVCAGGCPIKNFYATGSFYENAELRCGIVRELLAALLLELNRAARPRIAAPNRAYHASC